MSQGTPGSEGEQGRRSPSGARITAADLLTLSRIPLAVAFVLVGSAGAQLVILAIVAATDLSAPARRAVDRAAMLARERSASLTLVYAVNAPALN